MRRSLSTLCERSQLEKLVSSLRNEEKKGKVRSPLCAKALNLCNKLGSIQQGKWIHALMTDNALHIETHVGNTMISMYSKSGDVESAYKLFTTLPQRDVVTWTVMISAYAQNGYYTRAFELFRRLSLEGLKIDHCAFRVLLTICANAGALVEGRILHEAAALEETDLIMGNLLVNMYGKCGCVDEARYVFERMHDRNVVTWTSMVSAFASSGFFPEAMRTLNELLLEGDPRPNPVTFVVTLDACESLSHVQRLHALAVESGCVNHLLVGTTLVGALGSFGASQLAREVFEGIPLYTRTAVSWTTMVSTHTQSGDMHLAFKFYEMMQLEGVKPTIVTFLTLLGGASSPSLSPPALSSTVEEHLVESGFGETTFAGNSLMARYVRSEDLPQARRVFDRIQDKDIVSWNTIVSGHAQEGESSEALRLFRHLRLEGVRANEFTLIAALTACTTRESLRDGKLIHEHVRERGYETETLLSALVSMYGRCGEVQEAQELFLSSGMQSRDRVSLWNTLITLNVQSGENTRALELYRRMKLEGVKPDVITYTSVLDACSAGTDLVQGRKVHDDINESQRSETGVDLGVGNALLDMYGKCGNLGEAERLFSRLGKRNVITWTAMLAMYAQHGEFSRATRMFYRMQQEGVRPNEVTVTVALFACSHGGLLEEGYGCFERLKSDYLVTPSRDHFTCMVDLLGRSGRVAEAEELLRRLPEGERNGRANWTSLLSSCRNFGDVERARRATGSGELVLSGSSSSAFVVLSHVYASGAEDSVPTSL